VDEGAVHSPAYRWCPHVTPGHHRCALYRDPARPSVCRGFQCAWLRGIGEDADRPDKIGAMLSVNRTPGGVVGFVMETEKSALYTTARAMVATAARTLAMPWIVSRAGKRPPRDKGDLVVLRADLVEKAHAMLGTLRRPLAPDIAVYAFRR
jgi:hypothetical protein